MKKAIVDYEKRTTKKVNNDEYIVIFATPELIIPNKRDILYGFNPNSRKISYGRIHKTGFTPVEIYNPDYII